MWAGDEEAGEGGDDDWDEGCAGLFVGDEGVDEGEGVGEEGDGDDEVGWSLDFGCCGVFLLRLEVGVVHRTIWLLLRFELEIIKLYQTPHNYLANNQQKIVFLDFKAKDWRIIIYEWLMS